MMQPLSIFQTIQIPDLLVRIAKDIKEQRGDAYIVGGWVRDQLLKIPSKDFDIEVYGIDWESLEKVNF